MMDDNFLIRSAAVDITNKCNFRCLHCYNKSGEHINRESEMNDNEILKVMNEIIELQPDSICLCGGEPLLRVNLIYKICKLVKSKNPNISLNMVSNGFFMTQEIASNLKKSGINLIQISLDGSTEKSHNWLRNNDLAFKMAINAIKIVSDMGIRVNVACTPTKINYNEIESTINLCSRLGVNTFRLQPLMIMGRGSKLSNYVLNDEEYHRLSLKIKELSSEQKEMRIEWGDPLQHIENILYTKKKSSFIDFGISAYGDIMISPYIPVMVGNIKKEMLVNYVDKGLKDIFLDPFIKKVASLITDWGEMNMNKTSPLFPVLGSEKNINYDLIRKEDNDLDVINAILKME